MSYLEQQAALSGKTAIVVGGAGGLGRAATEALARAGVRVAFCDKNEAFVEDLSARLTDEGLQTLSMVIDARDVDALETFFDRVDTEWGPRLDTVVNVVGGTFRQSFADSIPKGWDALVRANFSWMLTSLSSTIPRLRAAGGGSIINFTSIEAHRAAPGHAVYAAMKSAVWSLTRTLAVELGPDAIRVNAIAADQTPTEGASMRGAHETDEERSMRVRVAIPAGRLGTPDDIGGCVLFLASDLSRYVTGTTLHPDGGALASSGWWNWPDIGFFHSPSPAALAGLMAPSLTAHEEAASQ